MLIFDGVGRSKQEIALLIRLGTGLDTEEFNRRSLKTEAQLVAQIKGKDIKGIVLSPDRSAAEHHQLDKLHQFYLTGSSQAALGIRNHTLVPDEMLGRLLLFRRTIFYEMWYEDMELREVARIHTKDGAKVRVDQEKEEAGSETLKTGEGVKKGTKRALQEETKVDIDDLNLIEEIATDGDGEGIGPIKPSSVYARCWSQQIYRRVRVWLPKEFWPKLKDGNVYMDDGVEIHQRWFPRTKR